jgi:hypothetical protein
MDNLGSHRGQAVRRLIRAAGAKLFFLARYSPDLNPIEQVFAKLKTLLRKTDPRTIEATWRSIGSLLERFTPQHALAATPSLFSDALPISKSYMGRQCAYDTEFTTTEYVLVSIRAMAAGNSEPLTWLLYCSLIGSGWQGFAGWAVASETPKLLLSRNTLSTEEQVKIGQILIGLSVLPLLAGAATAAQPTLLSDTQMDKVTAGDNELPAGFVTSTIQITTARGFIPVQIKYAIFPVCDTCSPTAALANAALAALLPPNP